LSTLQSKMAKQKKDVNNAAKKKSKKTDIDVDNKVNVIKLQQMKSFDESQKPTMNGGDKKKNKNKTKEKEITKKPATEMNDVKIQVSSWGFDYDDHSNDGHMMKHFKKLVSFSCMLFI